MCSSMFFWYELERRRTQLRLVGRQLPLDEVVAQRDPVGRPVVAVVDPLNEFGEQLLGRIARVAAGVRAVAVASRRRVNAVEHDGVVTVALASDVSLTVMTS